MSTDRGNSVGCHTFRMPSDEEIRRFVLMSGGGHGEIEESSSQFRIVGNSETKSMSSSVCDVDEDWEICAALNASLDKITPTNAVVYGKIVWESKMDIERSGYVRVRKQQEPAHFENPHLIRFLLERVWGIKRPNLLITVTGGAKDFELGNEQKDELLQGLTEAAKSVGAWFITGGTNTGIMRFMGEARALYANHVPLIGIAPWGVVKGRQRLYSDRLSASKVRFSSIQPAFYESACRDFDKDFSQALGRLDRKRHGLIAAVQGVEKMRNAVALERVRKLRRDGSLSVHIDPNHSHFIFTHDESVERFGGETAFRSQLEACIAEGRDCSKQILQRLKFMRVGWEGLNFRAIESAAVDDRRIPAVCVCVQGGPGTVDTVHGAVLSSTPVLLIKGSGKAADLLADAVGLVKQLRSKTRTGRRSAREQNLYDVLSAFKRRQATDTLEAEEMVAAVDSVHRDSTERNLILTALQAYEMAPADKEPARRREKGRELMGKVVQCATLPGCAVYDLDDPDPAATDLNGSLLLCILDNMGHGDDDAEKVLTDKLLLAVKWNRPDILGKVLGRTSVGRDPKQRAVATGLTEALRLGRVAALQTLMDHGADLRGLTLSEASIRSIAHAMVLRDREQARQASPEAAKASVVRMFAEAANLSHITDEQRALEQKAIDDAVEQKRKEVWLGRLLTWRGLLKACKDDQQSQHVLYLIDEARRRLRKDTRAKGGKFEGLRYGEWWLLKKRAKLGLGPAPVHRSPRAWWLRGRDTQVHSQAEEGRTVTQEEAAALLSVWRLESIYQSLLGAKWRFVAGMMGPAWDLLLWSVLMNRHALARMVWERCEQPVMSALTACFLYRRMARLSCVKPEARSAMLRNAADMEELACAVQLLAMEEDMTLAVEALETPRGCWGWQTAFDLAVQSDCKVFVERCCSVAMDKRWSGDINPYFRWLSLRMELWVILSILTGGLIAPLVLEFDLPPDSEGARSPSQRRRAPEGFPTHPFENTELKRRFDAFAKPKRDGRAGSKGSMRNINEMLVGEDKSWHLMSKLQRDPSAIRKLTVRDKQELWAPTFSFSERFLCFWEAPVTLFMVRAMAYSLMVVVFTTVLRNFAPNDDRESLSGLELVVASWMVGSVLKELHQVLLIGPRYFADPWNVIDIGAIASFWAGFVLRVHCIESSCRGMFIWDSEPVGWLQSVLEGGATAVEEAAAEAVVAEHLKRNVKGQEVSKLARQLWGLALFFCWLRFLHLYSVDRVLGPLVLALRRMAKDILTFVFIWGVVLMAFAAVLHGGNTEVECAEDSPTLLHVQCGSYWWVLRTYFQAYGELFLSEINDSVSVFMVMLLLLILQLVLNNTMFVAVITATFQSVWDQSQREWMVDMYRLTQDFSRTTSAVPIPLNVAAILYDLFLFAFHHSTVQRQTEEERAAGLAESSYWAKHERLHSARDARHDILPHELRAELTCSTMLHSDQLGSSDHPSTDPHMQHMQARREQMDRRVRQRSLALMERARARYKVQEKGKGQTAKADAQLRLIQDKVMMLERDQLDLKEGQLAILEALSKLSSQPPEAPRPAPATMTVHPDSPCPSPVQAAFVIPSQGSADGPRPAPYQRPPTPEDVVQSFHES